MTKNLTADAVVLEDDLPESPQQVWRALTEPRLLAAWIGPNDIRPEVGAEFKLGDGTGKRAPVHCRILEAEPHRRLRWQQWERDDSDASDVTVESIVSFELSQLPNGGTRLRLVHDAFAKCSIVAMASVPTVAVAKVLPMPSRRVGSKSTTTPTTCSLGSWRRAA
jgi:uncharacterized protein YndB with AHSA1/START domain